MEYTPFRSDDPPDEFKRAGIAYVAHPRSAHVILSRFVGGLQKFAQWPSHFAIWTNEPRFDMHVASPVRVLGIALPVHVMNVYTGVSADNYLGMWRHRSPIDRDVALQAFSTKPRRAVMLATYYPAGSLSGPKIARADPETALTPKKDGQLLLNGRDLDLTQRRQALALHLQRQGFCDIYGRDWPATVKISGESRGNNWPTTKQQILGDYAFNLAFENTIAAHYVTEKIWDAIKAACLPVYHGPGTGIYDDFPRNSFVEAARKTNAALGKEIMSMSRREAADRYETCLDVYLQILQEDRHGQSVAAMLKRTVEFLEGVMTSRAE